MKFKSTLEKHMGQAKVNVAAAEEIGYKEDELISKIFKMVTDSSCFLKAYSRATMVSRTIQPSINDKDLKIASDMMMALASELMLGLVREGLISINK